MASPRALSPSSLHAFSPPSARLSVTSPRTGHSTMNRPSSPLSPRTESQFHRHLDPYQAHQSRMSPQRTMPRAQSTQQRRQQGSNLQLPGLPALPRFHPAKYPSAASSLSASPRAEQNVPAGPVSPGLQQRIYSEAQRRIYQYQRETLPGWSTNRAHDPGSVYLAPLGSPGLPMTPLVLDESPEGYMDSQATSGQQTPQEQGVDQQLPSEELPESIETAR